MERRVDKKWGFIECVEVRANCLVQEIVSFKLWWFGVYILTVYPVVFSKKMTRFSSRKDKLASLH